MSIARAASCVYAWPNLCAFTPAAARNCDLQVTIDDLRKFGPTELGCQRCNHCRLHKDMKDCSNPHSKVCRERIKGKLSETPEGKVRLDRVQARLDRSRLPNREAIPPTVRGEKVNHN